MSALERQQAIAHYVAAWNADGADAVAAALARCWTTASTYTDTVTDTVVGVEGMIQLVRGTAERYPGYALRPTSSLDTHHEVGRFSWLMTMPGIVEITGLKHVRELPGVNFVEFTPDNRIARIVGFFG